MAQQQTVIVTGGASGIGFAVVEAILAEGWRAVLLRIKLQRLAHRLCVTINAAFAAGLGVKLYLVIAEAQRLGNVRPCGDVADERRLAIDEAITAHAVRVRLLDDGLVA